MQEGKQGRMLPSTHYLQIGNGEKRGLQGIHRTIFPFHPYLLSFLLPILLFPPTFKRWLTEKFRAHKFGQLRPTRSLHSQPLRSPLLRMDHAHTTAAQSIPAHARGPCARNSRVSLLAYTILWSGYLPPRVAVSFASILSFKYSISNTHDIDHEILSFMFVRSLY